MQRYLAPLEATTEQLRGLPPTLIQTAENDVLPNKGEAYAASSTRPVGCDVRPLQRRDS